MLLQDRAHALGTFSVGDVDEQKWVTLACEVHELLSKVVVVTEYRPQPTQKATSALELLGRTNDERRLEDIQVIGCQTRFTQRLDDGLCLSRVLGYGDDIARRVKRSKLRRWRPWRTMLRV